MKPTYQSLTQISEKLLLFRFIYFFLQIFNSIDSSTKSDDFNSFALLKQHFLDEEIYDLLTCKGTYPYENNSSTSSLHEEKLPPIEAFYD